MSAVWPPALVPIPPTGDFTVYGDLIVEDETTLEGDTTMGAVTGTVTTFVDETDATSTTAGAIMVAGGVAVAKTVWSATSRATIFNPDDNGAALTGSPGMYRNGTDVVINTGTNVNFHDGATGTGAAYVDVGAGTFHGAAFLSTSDARAKSSIESLTYEDARAKLDALRPVHYEFDATGEETYGFIAQEVQPIIPEMVVERESGQLALDQTQLLSLVVRVMQGPDH